MMRHDALWACKISYSWASVKAKFLKSLEYDILAFGKIFVRIKDISNFSKTSERWYYKILGRPSMYSAVWICNGQSKVIKYGFEATSRFISGQLISRSECWPSHFKSAYFNQTYFSRLISNMANSFQNNSFHPNLFQLWPTHFTTNSFHGQLISRPTHFTANSFRANSFQANSFHGQLISGQLISRPNHSLANSFHSQLISLPTHFRSSHFKVISFQAP